MNSFSPFLAWRVLHLARVQRKLSGRAQATSVTDQLVQPTLLRLGLGIKSANLGKKAKFTITSCDSQGRQRKRGGDVYAVKLNKGEYEVKVDVKDNDNGTYLAEYTVPYQNFIYDIFKGGQGRSGQYTLSVCLRGAHIKGSPFVVQVTRSSPGSERKC